MANSSDDFSQVISDEVTCPVCLDELKEPKILLCSHNVCRECLELMSRNKNLVHIVCPVCRTVTPIPKGGVRCLPTNRTIVRVVEATLARKAKIEMKNSLATGKPVVELLAKKISDLDKALRVLNEIHEKADKLVDVIRNQEANLCREVEEFYGIKCETIDGEKSDLDKLHSSASSSVQLAETILKQTLTDPTKTINVAKALKEQIEEITKLDLKRDMSTRDEDLEFKMNAEANINSIFEDEKFGKLTNNTNITSQHDQAAHIPGTDDCISAMITRRQEKAASNPEVMSEPSQGNSKTTQQMAERYNNENCIICSSKATHYCLMCKKRSCKSCTIVVTRLPCDSYKEHRLVEISPTTNNEKADLGSKDVCSFCGVSAASHNCIYCRKTSCSICHKIYTNDPCVPGISAVHHFVNQQQQKSTSEKQETASQKQATLSSKEKKPKPVPHISGENYCDFCALAANLICKACLKTICDDCKHVYTQDLCPPTKREHQFENINEQSTNTNEAEGSSLPWSCERCTFSNSSSHRICAVCATSRGVHQVDFPKSASRKCQNCTYANEEGATICKLCSGTLSFSGLPWYREQKKEK